MRLKKRSRGAGYKIWINSLNRRFMANAQSEDSLMLQKQEKLPEKRLLLLYGQSKSAYSTSNSMRRFFLRPSAVALSATGWLEPKPSALRFPAGIALEIK